MRLFKSLEGLENDKRIYRKQGGDGMHRKKAAVNRIVTHTNKIKGVETRKCVYPPEYGQGNKHSDA